MGGNAVTSQPYLDRDAPEVGALADLFRWVPAIFGMVNANAAGPIALAEQRSLSVYRPTLITPSEAAEMVRRGLLSDEDYRKQLVRAGYSTPAYEAFRGMIPSLLDPGSLVEMLRRGALGLDDYAKQMRLLGYDAENAAQLAALRYYMPPVQDVISWAVREVFTPGVRERFGQDQDFPDAMLGYAERVGISEENARNYWAAHWALPSPAQGFEMYQRSEETGVTRDDLDLLLRAQDVMPFWRDKLTAIAFNPITRVDVRRLHKLGLLDFEGMVSRYRRVGYNPDDARLLAQFTEKQNAQEDNDALEPFRASYRTHARSLYLDGVISDAELGELFDALGYSPENAAAFVQEAAFVREAEGRKVTRNAVKASYTTGTITLAGATARLVADGYTDTDAARIVEQWHVLRELRELTEAERADRDLSRADILGAYSDALMARDEAKEYLGTLNYDEQESELLVARVDFKRESALRADAERTVRALYIARRLGRDAASGLLGQSGIADARIKLLVQSWDRELDARAPALTAAQIAAALRRGIIDKVYASARLDELGYTTDDRDILIALTEKGDTSAEQGA